MGSSIVNFSFAIRPPLPPELMERYEIMEMLSDTSQAETYLLRSREDGRALIAKLNKNPSASDGGEPAILARLDHPAIPRTVETVNTAGAVCVVREYVEGDPLNRLEIPLGQERVSDIAAQLCDVLTYLHSRTPPVIHRDIKPQNVIFDEGGKIHLIDFGISRQFSDSAEKDTMFIGTDGFAPPEQYGFKQTDCRADIYSMGILLCYLITAGRDLSGLNGLANKRLARVIRKCAAFAPEDRYPTADAAKKAIIKACNNTTRRIGVAAAVIALLAISAAFLIFGNREAPKETVEQDPPPAIAAAEAAPLPERPPEQTDTAAPPAAAEETSPSTTITAPVSVRIRPGAEAVVFREPLIERAVLARLGLRDGEALTEDELALVTGLYIYSDRVFSTEKEFNDFALEKRWVPLPLSGDVPLISSLEDLLMMPNLRGIEISHQDINDYSPLSQLNQLQVLVVVPSQISDLSLLEELNNLQFVGFPGAPFTDITPLLDMQNLTGLSIMGCTEFALEPLRHFRYLQNLSADGEHWKYLPHLSPLNSLHLLGTEVDSLEYFSAYKSTLEDLVIHRTKITSLGGIEEYTRLQKLDISNTGITDLEPLLLLPDLKEVRVSPYMLSPVREIRDRANFIIEFWDE